MRQLKGRIGSQRDGIIMAFSIDGEVKRGASEDESKEMILENEADEGIQFFLNLYKSTMVTERFRHMSDEEKVPLLSLHSIMKLNSISI